MAMNNSEKINLSGQERVLIVRPDHIGDLVLTLPIAKCLRDNYPKLHIEFLVSNYNAPLLKYVNYIDGYIILDYTKSQPGHLISQLDKGRYHIAIFAKPGWLTVFASFIADIPVRIGTARRPYSLLFNKKLNYSRKHSNYHESELNLMMLQALGIKPDLRTALPEIQVDSSGRANLAGIVKDEAYVVIHPGSKGSAPNWPVESYVKLMDKLSDQKKVVVTGKDESIPELPGKVINLVDKTDFDGLLSIISKASLFISGSTGPLHVASACGVPVIGLFPDHPVLGPQRWGPRGKNATYLTPSKQNEADIRKNNNVKCIDLSKISVETVYKKALELLEMQAIKT